MKQSCIDTEIAALGRKKAANRVKKAYQMIRSHFVEKQRRSAVLGTFNAEERQPMVAPPQKVERNFLK